MLEAFSQLIQHKALLFATTQQSLSSRFTSSVLGFLWVVIYPLVFLLMYSLVFIYILGIRVPGLDNWQYVLVIFSGLVPFLAFSESFSVGTSSIISNRGLLRNTLLPIEMIVAKDVLVGNITMALGLVLIWLAVVLNGHIHISQLFVIPVFALQIIMTLGIVWLMASLTVFFRDILQTIPIITLFLMLVSPIGYTDEMVPEKMKFLLNINPLAWLMELYRSCFLKGFVPLGHFLLFLLFSLTCFIIGYRVISKLKPIFIDYV